MKQATTERLFWISGWAYDFSKIATVFLVIGLITHYFFFSIMIVRGASMEPNYVDGNVQIINRSVYYFHEPERGDAIAMYFPGETEKRFIKRIIGLPGEKVAIKNGTVYVNDRLLEESYLLNELITGPDLERQLPTGQYFVMGDNRLVSSDSRAWGPVPKSFIIGKVEKKLFQFSEQTPLVSLPFNRPF